MTALERTSGGFALRHSALTVPPVHIPDGAGGSYKTELVIERTAERTEKILWWYADDPRPEPHNHPWDFTSEILHGGYTEDRWWIEDGQLVAATTTYRAGDINHISTSVFHNVRDVEPDTVTHMICGPAVPGNEWCYLDVQNLMLLASDNPSFRGDLEAINPHLRTPEVEQ